MMRIVGIETQQEAIYFWVTGQWHFLGPDTAVPTQITCHNGLLGNFVQKNSDRIYLFVSLI